MGRPLTDRMYGFNKKSTIRVATAIQDVLSGLLCLLIDQLKKEYPFLRKTENDWAPYWLLQYRSECENREMKRRLKTKMAAKSDDDELVVPEMDYSVADTNELQDNI
jgi:hypothetical protein